jgi:opacity protein-like surface antigen
MKMISQGMLLIALLACPTIAFAQENELAVLVGGMKTGEKGIRSTQTIRAAFDGAATYEVNYARRFVDGSIASLYWEILGAGAPRTDVNATGLLLPRNYSTIFVTPGLKLKLFPGIGLSPYIAAGAGYGRYQASELLTNQQANTADREVSTWVFNYGGGVDLNVIGPIAIRGEIRDFITGSPSLNAPFLNDKQHNVTAAAGLVLRWGR